MKHLIRCAAIGAIAWLALAGCHANEDGTNPAGHKAAAVDLTLKLYAVPTDRTKSIQEAVDSALGGIDVKLFGGARASITTAGPGKLLVYAPREAQSSIGSVIATLSTSPQVSAAPIQPAPVQVNVHFWIVDGVSGEGRDDPALQTLAPTLAVLRKTGGPLRFQLDQSAAAITTPSEGESTIIIAKGSYSQAFNFRLDRLTKQDADLRLTYEDHGPSGLEKLTTQVETPFGQYIVLAQAPGACPASDTVLNNGQKISPSCADKPAMRLLIVRVDRLPPKA